MDTATVTEIRGKKRPPAGHELGVALDVSELHAPPIVMAIPLADIDESPSNPRKTFKDLQELGEDIKRHGLLEPVLLRPSPRCEAGIGRYELVFGARRYRASKLAGLHDIHATVRQLSDEQVLEIQIVENCAREDIHPLEEADGYRALSETHGWSVEDIAAKVGKSVATVRSRLKLAMLPEIAKRAVFDGALTLGGALFIARIPHADIQVKAVKAVLAIRRADDGPLSQADVARYVRQKFVLRLMSAPFDRADASLVAGAPACAACPKRTGNQREMYGDVDGEEDDLCMDVKCFDAKKDQAWKNRVAEAEAKQQAVLPAKKAKELFPYSGSLVHNSDYVDLGDKNYQDAKSRTNKAILGKSADVPIVVARDEDGGIHELVKKDDFRKAVKGTGIVVQQRESSSIGPEEKKRREAEAKKKAAYAVAVGELVASAEKREPNETFWRALARAFVRGAGADARRVICQRRAIEAPKSKGDTSLSEGPRKALLAAADTMTAAAARGLCVELAVTSYQGNVNEEFKELQRVFGVAGKKKPKTTAAKKTAKRGRS
jgi:ParB/RepB/Spo0J family partition protein